MYAYVLDWRERRARAGHAGAFDALGATRSARTECECVRDGEEPEEEHVACGRCR